MNSFVFSCTLLSFKSTKEKVPVYWSTIYMGANRLNTSLWVHCLNVAGSRFSTICMVLELGYFCILSSVMLKSLVNLQNDSPVGNLSVKRQA